MRLVKTRCQRVLRTTRVLPTAICLLVWLSVATAYGQVDRVYPNSGSPVSGKIIEILPQGVIIESGGKQQNISVDKIRRIIFQDEPSALTRGRDFVLDGQFEQAIEALGMVDFAAIKREVIKADAMFYLARSEAAMALIGRGNVAEAARKMNAFVSANRQSLHFFSAAQILGDLAVASGNYDQAIRYYAALAQAPTAELKIQSEYLVGNAHLRQGKLTEAAASLSKVIGASVQSPEGLRLQALAKAGQAVVWAKQGQGEQALQQVNSLITTLDPVDSALAARIYNAQGACFEALGDQEGAVLAYLHTHLMFSSQADAHAESLTRLVELWPRVGNADRGVQARQELQQRYPGWLK